MPETPNDIVAELHEVMRKTAVVLRLASSGLIRLHKELSSAPPPPPENPDPAFMVGSGDPNNPESFVMAAIRHSQVLDLAAPGGFGRALLDQFWIVYVYETWEGDVRGRLAAARGVLRDDIRSPYFGDLRRLRHDSVHHAGIATEGNTGRCDLLAGWFPIGDRIQLTDHQMRLLVYDMFPEAELVSGSAG